jgi:hypothetical protein
MPRGLDAAHDTVAEFPSDPSGSCAPIGVSTERVAPETLQAVDQLFPAPCNGLEFLALLLRLAICKQMALANMGMADVAEITVQSIRILAKKIGWSYESTHKYVVLFCALGLLIKSRENGLVKLRFPLSRYQPPHSLQKLDELIDRARPKVVSCAKRVKRRFGLLYGTQIAASEPTQQMPAAGSSDLLEVLADLRQVMELPEAGALRERLKVIEAKLARLNGRLASEKSTISAGQEERIGRLPAEKSTIPASTVHTNGRFVGKTVDFSAGTTEERGRLAGETVDSLPSTSIKNGRFADEKSTATGRQNFQNGRLSGEKSTVSAKMVDSEGVAAANVNVIIKTKFERFNDNVREPIEYLRTLFQEPEGKRGYYYNLLKSCAQADIWLIAAVETFVASQRQTDPVRDPGRYFYDRVVAMHREGVSDEARQLVKRYGDLSYAQLQAVVRNVPSSMTFAPAGRSPSGPRPRLGRIKDIVLRLPRDRHVRGMSQEDLAQVRQEIGRVREYCAWRKQNYQQDDGTYALLIESPLRRQIWLYRREHWQDLLATLVPPISTGKPAGGF